MSGKKEQNAPVEETPSQPESIASTEHDPLEQHNKPNVQILYETTSATLANHVIVNSGRDQIILDFSTGIISDHASGRHVLPIQSRVAMTPANAVKLIQTLSGVLQQIDQANRDAFSEARSTETADTDDAE